MGGVMLLFDLYLFDEAGRMLQQVALEAASHEGAREKALYLQKTQQAASHLLMSVSRASRFVPPSEVEVDAHHQLLQARDQLRRQAP